MIRRGKQEGWLSASNDSLTSWSAFNGICLDGVKIEGIPGKGLAVIASKELDVGTQPLMTIPRGLVLCKETVELHAKVDRHLREILEKLGDFGKTSRGSILCFLLMQATRCCPDVDQDIGVANPLSEYIKFLPMELLPTFWNDEEVAILHGTSLYPATGAKTKSLYREFDELRAATAEINWCKKYWWDEIDGLLGFDDWKNVDAFYRSRALEFPGIGDSMVPCIDMANHASGDITAALYEADSDGNGVLLLRDDKKLAKDDEVTITYGDKKGACEMIFSYGFLEEGLSNARDVFLDLSIPDDDPLKMAKCVVAQGAPGVRLYDSNGLRWESDYIWLICVNEEDGLKFELCRTVDGQQEIHARWRDEPLDSPSKLKVCLETGSMWEVYHLRVVSILQERVERQLQVLYDYEDAIREQSQSNEIRDKPRSLAMRLRELEFELLERFYEHFEEEKERLAETGVVKRYLQQQQWPDGGEEFS